MKTTCGPLQATVPLSTVSGHSSPNSASLTSSLASNSLLPSDEQAASPTRTTTTNRRRIAPLLQSLQQVGLLRFEFLRRQDPNVPKLTELLQLVHHIGFGRGGGWWWRGL